MRIQYNLLSLFLLGLVIASIVEASEKWRKKRKRTQKEKRIAKRHHPSSIFLDETSDARSEVPVPPVFTTPGSSSSSSSFFSFANKNDVTQDVITALNEKGFKSIKRDWEKWRDRVDLFDHVVTKSVDFIARFINQVENAKRPTLAALFVKRPDAVDEVLKKITYNDHDLTDLA